jgi:nicotinamide phosphoribosyltransferase
MENLLLMTDSYKASHYLQYPPKTQAMFSYLESRGGKFDKTVFFGLQYLLQRYLSKPITKADILEAKDFFKAHGTTFPEDGWNVILNRHGGYLPVKIRAVREGSVIPTHNLLLSVRSTDPDCFWVVTWIESLLMRLWYPITVATQSWHIKNDLLYYFHKTSDGDDAEVDFKLHDFGARGVSSSESAGIGGAAHLVNFKGSDTLEGVYFANKYYKSAMAAFSIPASEHSTITAWGKDHEHDAFDNMLKQFAGPGKLVACVSDSFNIYEAVDYWASRSEDIKATGATLVIRPDSGDPYTVVLDILHQLKAKGLMTVNSKGYNVLPSHLRIIQGDGVNANSIHEILEGMESNRYATTNIAFGMGGALLQKLNRDTQKMAYKCSAVQVAGTWNDVYKEPITDPGKKSKKGILDLIRNNGYETVVNERWDSVLQTVYFEGDIRHQTTLEEVRATADAARSV